MKDPHQYKRRTYDEAYELARKAFREQVTSNLSEAEITEMAMEGDISGGSICNDWEKVVGFVPKRNSFYQFTIFHRIDECPYADKYYAFILVSRDRSTEELGIQWKPPMEPYTGRYFE